MEHTAPRTYRYTLTGRRNGHTIRVVVHATDRVDAQRKAWDKKPGFLAYSVAQGAADPAPAPVDDRADREWERICDEEGIKPRTPQPADELPGMPPVMAEILAEYCA